MWLHVVIELYSSGEPRYVVVTCCNRTVQQWGAKVRWLHVVIELYSSGEPRYVVTCCNRTVQQWGAKVRGGYML